MQVRFGNLLAFLRSNSDYERIRVALGAYRGSAGYILNRNVLITGIKEAGSQLPGYATTEVSYHGPTISAAIDDFDCQFDGFWQKHVDMCGTDNPEAIRRHVISMLEGMAPAGAVALGGPQEPN
jgi:hypothetical protein